MYQLIILVDSSPPSNDPNSNSTSGSGRGGPQQINENPLATVNSLEQLVLNIARYARHFETSVDAVAIRIRILLININTEHVN